MKPRLIYVVSPSQFFVSHRLVLAEAARDRGFDVSVVTPDGPGVPEIHAAGFEWIELPVDRGGMNPLRELRTLHFLWRLYRERKPAIVHHVTIKPVLYGTLAARLAGVPRVIDAISGMGFLFTGGRRLLGRFAISLYRLCLRHPDLRVIVQNSEDLALFNKERMAPAGTLVLIPGSGVDIAQFRPRRADGKADCSPMVVQTCRMLADKGVREFISAARCLRPEFPDARFVLVGAPDPGNPSAIDPAELEQAAAEGAIEWWGHRTDIPDILAQAAIYCLPSYREGLPKSLIEAAAAGLPLVTTDSSGCREVVRHEQNGLLVPVGDVEALATALSRLLRDSALRLRLGNAARQDAIERFALNHILEAQLELYRNPTDCSPAACNVEYMGKAA